MLSRILLVLAYSNVLLACCASAGAWVALRMAGSRPTWSSLVLPCLAMFVVYTFDKVLRYDPQDAINDPQRSALIVRAKVPLTIAFWVSLGLGVLWSARLGPGFVALFLFPAVAGVAYAVPFLPKHWRWRRIKDITAGKNLIVALAWGINCGLFPLLCVGAEGPLLLWSSVFLGGRFLVNTIYFDLGDLEGDRVEGTATLPVVIGFANTRTLLHAINAASCVVLLGMLWQGLVPMTCAGAMLIGVYGLSFLVAAKDESTDLGFWCDVVVDGEFAVLAVLVAMGGVA